MNDELRFEILQLCSGHYLSATLPDDWQDLSELEQNRFLTENAWQPIETYSPDELWDYIELAAEITQRFIHDKANYY